MYIGVWSSFDVCLPEKSCMPLEARVIPCPCLASFKRVSFTRGCSSWKLLQLTKQNCIGQSRNRNPICVQQNDVSIHRSLWVITSRALMRGHDKSYKGAEIQQPKAFACIPNSHVLHSITHRSGLLLQPRRNVPHAPMELLIVSNHPGWRNVFGKGPAPGETCFFEQEHIELVCNTL